MPIFLALQCAYCSIYIVQQRTANGKWSCRRCNSKQSITRVFAESESGAQIRQVIQKLSADAAEKAELQDELAVEAFVAAEEGVDGEAYTGTGAAATAAPPPLGAMWSFYTLLGVGEKRSEASESPAAGAAAAVAARSSRAARGSAPGSSGSGRAMSSSSAMPQPAAATAYGAVDYDSHDAGASRQHSAAYDFAPGRLPVSSSSSSSTAAIPRPLGPVAASGGGAGGYAASHSTAFNDHSSAGSRGPSRVFGAYSAASAATAATAATAAPVPPSAGPRGYHHTSSAAAASSVRPAISAAYPSSASESEAQLTGIKRRFPLHDAGPAGVNMARPVGSAGSVDHPISGRDSLYAVAAAKRPLHEWHCNVAGTSGTVSHGGFPAQHHVAASPDCGPVNGTFP